MSAKEGHVNEAAGIGAHQTLNQCAATIVKGTILSHKSQEVHNGAAGYRGPYGCISCCDILAEYLWNTRLTVSKFMNDLWMS